MAGQSRITDVTIEGIIEAESKPPRFGGYKIKFDTDGGQVTLIASTAIAKTLMDQLGEHLS